MSNMGERIKQLRIKKGITQEELGNVIGVQKSAIRKYESGLVQNIKRSSIKKMADYFGVSPSYLLGWDDDSRPAPDEDVIDLSKLKNVRRINPRRFPLLGKIACGQPILAVEEHDSYVIADRDIDADFCVVAKGDSMIGARIYDGDIIFIKQMPTVENGEIAAVVIDDEVTLKRVFYNKESETVSLIPENLKYDPLVYHNSQLDQIHCLGKAVYFMGPVR